MYKPTNIISLHIAVGMPGFKHFLSLIFFICFIYTLCLSLSKFMKKRKLQELTYETSSLQTYPSISVCTKYAFKKYIDPEISGNMSLKEKEHLIKNNIWKRNETFYFVNQKSDSNDGFPCITTRESDDPGRACVFPFKHSSSNKVIFNCSNINSEEDWCYTCLNSDLSGWRDSFLRTKYGYCPKRVSLIS